MQLVDTDFRGNPVGPGANALYLGIELESIGARRGFEHSQDPNVVADELTTFQMWMGRQVVNWIRATHNIPKAGPPTAGDWMSSRGFLRLLGRRSFSEVKREAIRTGRKRAARMPAAEKLAHYIVRTQED